MAPRDENAEELARVADELLQQAADLRRGWEALAAALDDLDPAAAEHEPEGDQPAPVPDEAEDPRRLIALNMRLGGQSREATAEYLRAQFGDDGTEEILVSVYDA